MKAFKRGAIVLILMLATVNLTQAQNYNIKRVFIYNFIKYVQWPPAYSQGDFVIGVVGNSEMVKHLEDMATKKKAGGRTIIIKKYKSISEISKCNMLFIPKERSNLLPQILKATANISTLIISEKDGMAKSGSGINFVMIDGKPKFELNTAAIEQKNLRVSNELLSLAIKI